LAKPEWGLKRTCLGCGARFYDMQRDPIVCPSCNTEFDPLALVRPRRARAAAASKAKAAAAEPISEETVSEDTENIVDDDTLDIEDASIDLDDDNDDDIISDGDEDGDTITSDPDVSEVLDKAKDTDPSNDS